MRLVNHTSIDDSYLRKLIKFARPNSVRKYTIEIRKARRSHGKAWRGQSLVKVWISRKEKYPCSWSARPSEGYIAHTVNSMEEMLVHLIAHELRHLWQRKEHRKGTNKGPYRRKSKQSREYDADTYADSVLQEWRRANANQTTNAVN